METCHLQTVSTGSSIIAVMVRMGAGQSTYSSDAVPEQQKGRVGQFRLNKKERYMVKVVSDLFQQLLKENNLMDLHVLLSDSTKCNDLMVLSSRALENEFTRLRFPDPEQASKYISAFFLSKGRVDAMQTRESVKTMCQLVVGFLLRFVTLVAAITASMHTNEEYLSWLSRIGTTAQSPNVAMSTEKYKEPLSGLQLITGRTPLNSQIINELKSNGSLESMNEKSGYRFSGQFKVVINAEKAVIFQCYKEKTAILGIDIQDFVVPSQSIVQPYAPGPVPVPVLGQGPVLGPGPVPVLGPGPVPGPRPGQWLAPRPGPVPEQWLAPRPGPFAPRPSFSIGSSGASSYIGREQGMPNNNERNQNGGGRARRVTRRRQRRMHGGVEKYFLVTINQILNCPGSCALRDTFVINQQGRVFEKSDILQNKPYSYANFQERVLKSFESESTQFINEDLSMKTTLEEKSFGGLHEKLSSTLNVFNDISKSFKTGAEGANPANYRAYLLATALDNGALSTLFCNDAWSNNRFSNTVAYSLLNSLYIDRDDGVSESESRIELAGIVTKFVGEGVARPFLPASNRTTNPQSFNQIAFPSTPSNLKAFCEKLQISPQAITVRKTNQKEDIEILTNAHNELRELYNKHLESCVNLLRKAMSLKTREYGTDPIIQLEETFFKDERGARAVLEDIVREARQLLSTHYLNVEKVYRRALQDLGRRMTGNYSPASKQAINTNVNRLNKAKNLLNQD